MQKMARRHNKEGGNHLDQESNRQKAMEDIDGGLHPAVDGQSLGEGEGDGHLISKHMSTARPAAGSGDRDVWPGIDSIVGGGGGVVVGVCWLLNVQATCECISGADLNRQFYVLPH